MRSLYKLILPVIAFLGVLCLPSCQTVSADEPGVVEETAANVEGDRCEDWGKSLRWAGSADEFDALWVMIPERIQRHLLAQDAAWEAACGG